MGSAENMEGMYQHDPRSGKSPEKIPSIMGKRNNHTRLGPVYGSNLSCGVLAAGNLLGSEGHQELTPVTPYVSAEATEAPGYMIEYDVRDADSKANQQEIANARAAVQAAFNTTEQGEQ